MNLLNLVVGLGVFLHSLVDHVTHLFGDVGCLDIDGLLVNKESAFGPAVGIVVRTRPRVLG